MNAALQFPNSAFVDAQAAADSVYGQLGMTAPPPMAGESQLAYRARLLRGIQKHSSAFKDSDLGAVARADSTAFAAVENQIFEDARKFARTPQAVADGQMRENSKRTADGHMVTTWTGDPMAWMRAHMQRPMRVRFNTRP